MLEENKDYCTCSPDRFLWWKWKDCCYWHDRQYRNEVKERIPRKLADIELRECMKTKLPKFLWIIPIIYYYGARIMGLWTWKAD